tara:strand:- start:607 stop:1860 length:1254 start_codon:yes stop_codon:yes gene_type:complete
MYHVFKFGGASIEDLNRIKCVGEILLTYSEQPLVVVFSAMGKVTNMLEDLVDSYVNEKKDVFLKLQIVKDFHESIINQLFTPDHNIRNEINNLFIEIEWVLEVKPNYQPSYDYDQIVSVGELLSSKIMHSYLLQIGFENSFYDARDLIRTDNTYRNAKVLWEETIGLVRKNIKDKHCITQGFIGCTSENFTTTLGREGSDFSAAILAFALDVDQLVIWKDVPAMMNADPKYFNDVELIEKISYDEVIELAYFGAKIIHPKTIQPLKKKNIPLYIKSFLNRDSVGTKIFEYADINLNKPLYIIKEDQILISISDRSLAFIVENHMSKIFSLLASYSVEVNMMQNSAVSFSICVDNDKYKIPKLIRSLQEDFEVFYNEKLILYTIRYYTDKSVTNLILNKSVLLEQKTRNTLQIVVKDN